LQPFSPAATLRTHLATTVFSPLLQKSREKANAEICSPSRASSYFIWLLSGFWHLHVGRRPHIDRQTRKCRPAGALSRNYLGFRFGSDVDNPKGHRLPDSVKMSLVVEIPD
jgi:hypothetical protein